MPWGRSMAALSRDCSVREEGKQRQEKELHSGKAFFHHPSLETSAPRSHSLCVMRRCKGILLLKRFSKESVPPSQQDGGWELIRAARQKQLLRVWGGKGKGGAELVIFTFKKQCVEFALDEEKRKAQISSSRLISGALQQRPRLTRNSWHYGDRYCASWGCRTILTLGEDVQHDSPYSS